MLCKKYSYVDVDTVKVLFAAIFPSGNIYIFF